MSLASHWQDVTLIGFDLETSGKYPLQAEICEMAAVKYRGGEIIDEFQTLVKTTEPMSEEVIKIHNITNEMIADAPALKDVLPQFAEFVSDGYMIAHHAPFDMGFLGVAYEDYDLPFPPHPVFCSSLLSRKKIIESPNHRLQTLVKTLGIDGGQAHRALDDAKTCLTVTLEVIKRVGESTNIDHLFSVQGGPLEWRNYSMKDLFARAEIRPVIEAIRNKTEVQLTYQGGSRPGQKRTVNPIAIVRNPNGDFLVASEDPKAEHPKRYFLEKISASVF